MLHICFTRYHCTVLVLVLQLFYKTPGMPNLVDVFVETILSYEQQLIEFVIAYKDKNNYLSTHSLIINISRVNNLYTQLIAKR